MTLEERIIALAQAIGADVKALTLAAGSLSSLSTTNKSNLVAAINELAAQVGNASGIDDEGVGAAVTWSAAKIIDSIAVAKAAVKSDLLNGAGEALDTLQELADALGNDPNFATTIAAEIANRVRYDAPQTLTMGQQAQARDNIGAYGATEIGNYDRDLAAAYAAAKA